MYINVKKTFSQEETAHEAKDLIFVFTLSIKFSLFLWLNMYNFWY